MASFVDLQSFMKSKSPSPGKNEREPLKRVRCGSDRSKMEALDAHMKRIQFKTPDSGTEMSDDLLPTPSNTPSEEWTRGNIQSPLTTDKSLSDTSSDLFDCTFLASPPLTTPCTSRRIRLNPCTPWSDPTGSSRKRRRELSLPREETTLEKQPHNTTPVSDLRKALPALPRARGRRKVLKAKHRLSFEDQQLHVQHEDKENADPPTKTLTSRESRTRSRSPPKKQPRVSLSTDDSCSTSNVFHRSEFVTKVGHEVSLPEPQPESNDSPFPIKCPQVEISAQSSHGGVTAQVATSEEPCAMYQNWSVRALGYMIDKRPSVSKRISSPPPVNRQPPQQRSETGNVGPRRSGWEVRKPSQRYFDSDLVKAPLQKIDILKAKHLVERQVTTYGPAVPGELRWHINGQPTTMAKRRSHSVSRAASVRDMFRGHPAVVAASFGRGRSQSPKATRPRSESVGRRPRAPSRPSTSSWGKLPTVQLFFRESPGIGTPLRSQNRGRSMKRRSRFAPRYAHFENPEPTPEPQDAEYQEGKKRWIQYTIERDAEALRQIFLLANGYVVKDDLVDVSLRDSIQNLTITNP